MKIVETSDDVLKVYDDGEKIYLEFECRAYSFTPMEAKALSDTLARIANDSVYFKGLKTDRA